MKRRKWDAKIKADIVLQGLQARPVADICSEYNISQAQYYRWREQFLGNMYLVFDVDVCHAISISRENIHLKKIIGELTAEMKKANLARENIRLKKTIGNLAMELRKTKTESLNVALLGNNETLKTEQG